MKITGYILFSFSLLVSCTARVEAADSISHGRQVLLNRGLQLQAWMLHRGNAVADQFLDANFTTVNFYQQADPGELALFQAQANVPWQWARISTTYAYPDLIPDELPYLDKFASMQYGDELTQDQATQDAEKAAYIRWNQMYPNALAYTNFYGGGLGPSGAMNATTLNSYMQYTRPDVLMFDNYANFSFSTSARNSWYSTMQLYRTTALKGYDGTGTSPIAYAQYLNLYRTTTNGALPSESFVRLQQSASWAFGYTMTDAFIYNRPPEPSIYGPNYPVMFDGLGDSATPTPVFGYVAESNRQSRNLGPALVRMVSTGIFMKPGSGKSVSGTGLTPWSAHSGSTASYSDYLTAITPTVTQGGANSSSFNDILVGYFKPLLTDNSNATFVSGMHFMIVNGSAAGTAAASAQWYHLTFDFTGSSFNSLVELDRDTGLVELVPLTATGGSTYSLDLNLPGGSGDLFGFWNSSNPLPTVPEPTSLMLLGTGGVICWFTCVRKRIPLKERMDSKT